MATISYNSTEILVTLLHLHDSLTDTDLNLKLKQLKPCKERFTEFSTFFFQKIHPYLPGTGDYALHRSYKVASQLKSKVKN